METPDNEPAEAAQDPIATAWDALEASWDTDDAHRKFLALCDSLGRMNEAGKRYRAVVDGGGERAESASKRIDQLLAVAMSRMQFERHEPSRAPRRVVIVVGVVLAAGLLAFAAKLFFHVTSQ